jgi:hypothetical protein
LVNNTASVNTAVGAAALQLNSTGTPNTAVGFNALNANISGTNNVAVGDNALAACTAGYNTVIGSGAATSLTSGAANTVVGNFGGTNLTSGSNNIYVGQNTTAGASSVTDEIVIGPGLTGKGSSTGFISPNGGSMYQGNNSANWAVVSDQRIKENIAPVTGALDTINALNPVTFDYILTGKKDVSFIAQEYMKVLPDQVGTHAASPEEKELTGSDELYNINPNLVPYLVKAIQELSAKNEALEARLAKLEGK